MFMNEKRTIWTLQGHPEMNKELGNVVLGVASAHIGVDEGETVELSRRMGREHDGVRIWKRVLEWVTE